MGETTYHCQLGVCSGKTGSPQDHRQRQPPIPTSQLPDRTASSPLIVTTSSSVNTPAAALSLSP